MATTTAVSTTTREPALSTYAEADSTNIISWWDDSKVLSNKILSSKYNFEHKDIPLIKSDIISDNINMYKASKEWIIVEQFNDEQIIYITLDSNIWYTFLLDTWLLKHEFLIVKSLVNNKTSWYTWKLWVLDWWEKYVSTKKKTILEQNIYLYSNDANFNWFTPTQDKMWKDYWYFLWEATSEYWLYSVWLIFRVQSKWKWVKRLAKKIAKAKWLFIDVEQFKVVEACYELNKPCLFMWPTGCWKTTIVKELCKQKKHNLVRINLNWEITKEDLVWSKTLENWNVVWKDGPLTEALRKWDVILLDEINAALPEVLLLLQSLTEAQDWKLWDLRLNENNWEVVVAHEKCRIFWTWNPSDEYIWTKDFNPATLSRWIVLYISYLNNSDETELLFWKYSKLWLSNEFIKSLVNFWTCIRVLKETDEITYSCSTRDLEQLIELYWIGVKLKTAITTCITNKSQNPDDRKKIISNITKYFTDKKLQSTI